MGKYLLILFLILGLQTNLWSQKQKEVLDLSKKIDYLSIELNPILTSNLKFNNSGADLIRSKQLFTGELGIGYERHLNDNWQLKSSLLFGLMPYNFNFEFDAPENSIFQTGPYQDDYRTLDFSWSEYDYIRLYSALEATVTRRIIKVNSDDEISVGAGLRVFAFFVNEFEYEYSSTWYIDENNPYVQLFYANVLDTSSNRWTGSLLLESSYVKSLKNNCKLKTTLSFSYSPFKSLKGYYYFSNLGFSSSGDFSQSMTYVSLRLGYLFPLERKKRVLLNPTPQVTD